MMEIGQSLQELQDLLKLMQIERERLLERLQSVERRIERMEDAERRAREERMRGVCRW
jgi:hypothetical protein